MFLGVKATLRRKNWVVKGRENKIKREEEKGDENY